LYFFAVNCIAPDAYAADKHITQYNKFKQTQDELVAARPQIEARNAQLPPQQRENIEPAIEERTKTAKLLQARVALQKAQELGNIEDGAKFVKQIKQLQAQPALFGEADLVPLVAPPTFAEQVQQGQATAQRAREKLEAELAAISNIAKKGAQPSAAAQIKTQMDAAAARTLLNALNKIKIVDNYNTFYFTKEWAIENIKYLTFSKAGYELQGFISLQKLEQFII